MYELGRVYSENKHDQALARNLWEAALRQWQKQVASKPDPDREYKFLFVEITSHLALLEGKQGHYPQALAYMELWKTRSPSPEAVQEFIDDLRHKMSLPAPAVPPPQTPAQAP